MYAEPKQAGCVFALTIALCGVPFGMASTGMGMPAAALLVLAVCIVLVLVIVSGRARGYGLQLLDGCLVSCWIVAIIVWRPSFLEDWQKALLGALAGGVIGVLVGLTYNRFLSRYDRPHPAQEADER
jgi:hypothetical protein